MTRISAQGWMVTGMPGLLGPTISIFAQQQHSQCSICFICTKMQKMSLSSCTSAFCANGPSVGSIPCGCRNSLRRKLKGYNIA